MKKGTFTSVWDGGFEVTTPAELDEETGEVITESVEPGDVDILDDEIFTDEDGKDYKICPDCHTYILKTYVDEGVGKQLFEVTRCSNPDCDYIN